MPIYAKLVLSILVVAAAVLVHKFQGQAGHGFNSWLALGLGAFMILAMWLFPEAANKPARKDRG